MLYLVSQHHQPIAYKRVDKKRINVNYDLSLRAIAHFLCRTGIDVIRNFPQLNSPGSVSSAGYFMNQIQRSNVSRLRASYLIHSMS